MFRNSRLRRDEIAAVIVHPLHNLAQTRQEEEASTNLRNECGYECGYAAWLHQLRAACDRYALPLLFDETQTGFRLARGGAQVIRLITKPN